MKSICHTKSFEVDAAIATLFPLFSPEGERQWVPGWEYQNVMGTTELSEDYIFLTQAHDHGASYAIIADNDTNISYNLPEGVILN